MLPLVAKWFVNITLYVISQMHKICFAYDCKTSSTLEPSTWFNIIIMSLLQRSGF